VCSHNGWYLSMFLGLRSSLAGKKETAPVEVGRIGTFNPMRLEPLHSSLDKQPENPAPSRIPPLSGLGISHPRAKNPDVSSGRVDFDGQRKLFHFVSFLRSFLLTSGSIPCQFMAAICGASQTFPRRLHFTVESFKGDQNANSGPLFRRN
jgi:hypothetical protein